MNIYRNDSRGELDEVIVDNAGIHIERMSDEQFCIIIVDENSEDRYVLSFISSGEDGLELHIAEDLMDLEDDTPDFKKEES